MSKTLKPADRKGIVITNDAPMHIYGGIRGPINGMYYETVEKIGAILSDRGSVTQITSKGEKIPLDFTNFDKDLDPYDDEIDSALELITCIPDKIIDLEVTKTVSISTDVEECTFTSIDEKIATVTNLGLVTGIKSGKTHIRVQKDGYKSVAIPVTVINNQSITCDPAQISNLVVGQTKKIITTPDGASFLSENDEIATVTPDGLVEAISEGSTKIIVSAEGFKSTEVEVTTKSKPAIKCTPESIDELNVGEETTIVTEPTGVKFESENVVYAKVDDKGVVRGITGGSTNIIISKDGYKDTKVPVTIKAKTMQCTPTLVETLYVGDTQKITTDPETSLFSSENILIAKVSSVGVITGIKAGSTNIIVAKYGYYDVVIPVTVKDKPTITCEPSSIETLYVGEETTITPSPADSTFKSEDEEIATVTAGVVRGIKAGTTNIVVEKQGYRDVKVAVNVKDKPTIVCIPQEITNLTVDTETTIATEPTGASFRSEDDETATVTQDGLVRAVKEGSTNIIITMEGYQDATVPVTTVNSIQE